MHIVLERTDGAVRATRLGDDLVPVGVDAVADLPAYVAERERGGEGERPRWVWGAARDWYPELLAAGIRVERCVDLAASHRILATSVLTPAYERGDETWLEPSSPTDDALFALDAAPRPPFDPVERLRAQHAAVAASPEPQRIRLLLAAESAGVLVAEEMRHTGLPWRADVHDALLTETLGPRVAHGRRPAKLEALAQRLRAALDAPDLNPDLQPDLLAALRRAGLPATSTRKWELRGIDHPAIAPLLEYRGLHRLLTANGWHWLDEWVHDGRFRPEYVVGGVVTGRWATSGGGAMQLPRQVRRAVQADDGWLLVVADAAQLEPRVLAGLARDEAMAAAGRGRDFYDAVVEAGVTDDRRHAKVAMLGAMYGATTGDSARLMPRLARAFPKAIAYVDDAARRGERGQQVVSRLGRTSPKPPRLDSSGRERAWGRFTRNFVVQASAAEWALCWMAETRRRLAELTPGIRLENAPHLVFFLHDEVVVHTPAEHAEAVERILQDAARRAGELLFGSFPVDFPLSIASVTSYADAK